MNEKIKYLNMFVLLAILAGQVQYACTSYYCTMERKAVSAPSMTTTSVADGTDGICDECQGVIPLQHGQQTFDNNCFKVVSTEKSVISNFTNSQKSFQNFVVVSLIGDQQSSVCCHQSAISCKLFIQANPPPLDLPTLNSNLRI